MCLYKNVAREKEVKGKGRVKVKWIKSVIKTAIWALLSV